MKHAISRLSQRLIIHWMKLSALRLRSGSKTFRLFISLFLWLIVFLSLIPSAFYPTHAQKGDSFKIEQPAGQFGVRGDTEPSTIITNVIAIIFAIALLAVLFMLVWGAFERIISGGDKEKIAASSKRITNALIGLVLLALAFVILTLIGNILNFNILGPLILPSLGQPVTNTP